MIHSLDRSNGFGNSDWIRNLCCKCALLAPKSLAPNDQSLPDSAAPAIAANSFLRSLASADFPLFAVQTFDNLGTQWAGTLLGCLAAAMILIPFIFYRWGPGIRAKNKFAPTTSVERLKELEDGEKQV
jgi:hypothetical protein